MTYHDCENYHDCHILQTFGTNKQAFVHKITCHCTISLVADVMESCSTHYKCYWSTFKQGNMQLKCKSYGIIQSRLWSGRHQHHDYEDNITIVLTILKIAQPYWKFESEI